ncbi:mannosyltransferase putative-domain-containing protein [Tricharina praecox]|uniref:mannosyltransferase putative-domain-containing protein n=1 Tax=Tricharina praecox TaxID=43433 RepID=UPI00221E7F84|nr:mannosyltransferase putative-domain-containing protein [Tricharina praecox]KAI5857542.1 mannosyltransferase putative-domain-containing protein [Tricharina praecox]
MPRFSTSRIITVLLGITVLFSITYINWTSLFTLPETANTATSTTAQHPVLDPAQKHIKTFFAVWSEHLHAARPHIPPLKLRGTAAANVRGDDLPYPRKPARTYLFLTNHDVSSLRSSHAGMLRSLRSMRSSLSNTATDIYDGTGVVIVAGGEYFGPAIVSLRMLRRTGCTLRVEVFLGKREEYEPELCQSVLPALNARCVFIPAFLSPPLSPEVAHYQLKSLAMLFSTFRHVLYLDSDSIPLLDPTSLFTEKPYTSTGLVLWPDFWKATEDPVFWNITGMPAFPKDLPPTGCEAGQVLIDKRRHMQTLLLAVYYNIWGPGWYYELLSQGALGQGDKETFLSAAVVLGAKWARVKTPVALLGYFKSNKSFKGSGMVQFHPGDELTPGKTVRPAFIHANTPKMNAGHLVDEGDLEDKGKHVRLWGTKDKAVERFGEDIEMVVWQQMVEVGCELADVVEEWKDRSGLCKRLKKHWKIFEEGP